MVEERGGIDLMPEQGTRPVNKYLPPRPRRDKAPDGAGKAPVHVEADPNGFLGWLDTALEKLG